MKAISLRYWVLLSCLLLSNAIMIWFTYPKPYKQPSLQSTQMAQPVTPPITTQTISCQGNLLFMGDTMLARSIGQGILAGSDPYQFVADRLAAADLRIANIETTIASPAIAQQAGGKTYTFNAPTEVLALLQKHSIDVSVLANNHTSDYGPAATADMLGLFAAAKLSVVGAGTTPEQAFAPLLKTVPLHCKAGKSSPVIIGFVAANDIEQQYTAVGPNRPGGAYFDMDKLKASIAAARQQGAQFVIAITHWGIEYSTEPVARQQQLGHALIDAGADAVIGNHPHVVEPTETYQGKPIVYSLGNFIFDEMASKPNATVGEMVRLPLTRTTLGQPQPIPYHLNASGFPMPD